jgi:hypothetical protein
MLIFFPSMFVILLNIISLNSYEDSPSNLRINVEDRKDEAYFINSNGKYVYLNDLSNKTKENILFNFNEITSINYIGNDTTVNTTFWLKQPFEEKPLTHIPIYIVLIDVDANPFTGGSLGIDYRAKIFWNNNTKSWEKIIEQVSQEEHNRILSKDINFTNFFPKNDNYSNFFTKNYYPEECCFINFAIDLELLNYPNQFVMYSSLIDSYPFNNEYLFAIDSAKNVIIPQPQISIKSTEDPIKIKNEESRIIPIQINSTSFLQTQLKLYTSNTDIPVSITPEVIVPPKGSVNAFLIIPPLNNSYSQSSQISLVGEASIYQEGKDSDQYIDLGTKKINFLIEVIEHPFNERFNDILKELGILWKENTEIIILIIGIFLTPFGALIVDRITKRKSRKKL